MDLRRMLEQYSKGEIGISEVQKEISIQHIGYIGDNIAHLDLQREIRKGCPEVILALGKHYDDLYEIIIKTVEKTGLALISKVPNDALVRLCTHLKENGYKLELAMRGTTLLVSSQAIVYDDNAPQISIICAGTSDISIAEEARLMAKAMGCVSNLYYDVGIAGIHRLLPALKAIIEKNVEAIIVVAGMEGALPSVVSSLVDVPVIGVPSSVGYGMGSGGIGALTCMLQSCTFGLAVMNIDNGIGAGAFAALICKRISSRQNRIMEMMIHSAKEQHGAMIQGQCNDTRTGT
jgi:pyridinium-3,5-biscarboxylic acid mononucleotide synthase